MNISLDYVPKFSTQNKTLLVPCPKIKCFVYAEKQTRNAEQTLTFLPVSKARTNKLTMYQHCKSIWVPAWCSLINNQAIYNSKFHRILI